MFVRDIAAAPELVSTMTNEQWLDAISCPRVDPIKQGKKVSMTLKSDTESSDTDSLDMDSGDEELHMNQALPNPQENARKKHGKPDTSRSRGKK